MNEVNFSVRINGARSHKIDVWLARNSKSKRELVDHVIDNIDRLKPALDATCATPRKARKK
jgi:hypothetical protein